MAGEVRFVVHCIGKAGENTQRSAQWNMCHICEDKHMGLGILELATRNRKLAESYGTRSVDAIKAGDSRLANIAARQASRYAVAAEHFSEEYRRRFMEMYGRDPGPQVIAMSTP